LVLSCRTTAQGQQRQVNAYPGVNNLEVLNLGARGGQTSLAFEMTAPSLAALAAAEAAVRAYQLDGGKYVFVDRMGVAWPGVILDQFGPAGDVDRLADGSGYSRTYSARLLHTQ
jgi:hypothetical protein